MPKFNNRFKEPEHAERTILDEDGKIVGTIRVKPSGLSWKPKGQQKFFTVELEKFADWIVNGGAAARRTKS